MNKFFSPFVLNFLLGFSLVSFSQEKKILLPPIINEASGMVVLGEDSVWWINDSGDGPFLYLTNMEGVLLDKWTVPHAQNRDWEDLSHDDKGNIYIADLGNNCRCREDLKIYVWNPRTGNTDSILFRYYPQSSTAKANYDLEGMFWYKDSLNLITKGKLAEKQPSFHHFKVPAKPGSYVGTYVGSDFLKRRVVTAASIREDGKEVVLLAYTFNRFMGFFPYSKAEVFIFRDFPPGRFWQVKPLRKRVRPRIRPTQFEAIDYWGPDKVWVGSEKTPVFKGQARLIELKKKKDQP